jgi:hypothetical protein
MIGWILFAVGVMDICRRAGLVQGANQSQQALAHMLGPLLAAVPSQFSAGAPYWLAGLIVVAGVVSVVGVAWALSVH